MWTLFQKNRLDQNLELIGLAPRSAMTTSAGCRKWPALGLRTDDASATQGAMIELATGRRYLSQGGGSEGVYGYESRNDSGYLDRFNVKKLLCRRAIL
jgi:hypothetical protein